MSDKNKPTTPNQSSSSVSSSSQRVATAIPKAKRVVPDLEQFLSEEQLQEQAQKLADKKAGKKTPRRTVIEKGTLSRRESDSSIKIPGLSDEQQNEVEDRVIQRLEREYQHRQAGLETVRKLKTPNVSSSSLSSQTEASSAAGGEPDASPVEPQGDPVKGTTLDKVTLV